jgi:16S rRNA C967 or C1407 C5-methylase (RsmB/RsmF family)/NOL1/NOP2/fmu family ribosome biogenesis protein
VLPDSFIKRIESQSYIDSRSLLQALGEPSPVSIRVNQLKWNRKPAGSAPVPWAENGFYLPERPSYTLDPLFHSGCYYPQEASGMFLGEAIRQSGLTPENIRVLDLCGAPGGKSTLISDMLGEGSFLVSNEVIRARAAVLAETVTKWGRANTVVTNNDPGEFGRLPGYFDLIFADAPCSGEGMFRNPVAVSEWSLQNAALCADRQKRILMDIWPALKENGILIYSTCTFNPAENEENINWLISQKQAECIRLNVSAFRGITEIDYNGISGYGFYPGKVEGEGFFISVIRKTGSQPGIQLKSQKKPELRPSKDELVKAAEWTNIPADRILKWGDEIYCVPCGIDEYVNLYQNLKIVNPGTRIFSRKGNDYLPSHELSLSGILKENSFPGVELSVKDAISYLRRDSIIIDCTKGWILVRYEEINLGFIKNLGNRINNYFPVGWRIRMSAPEPGTENLIKWEQGKIL